MSGQYGFMNGETEYEVVAASIGKMLGTAGRVGDYLSHIIVDPVTASPGTVTLIDGTTTVLTITPPASSQPFEVKVGVASKSGAWKIQTGANVTVMAVGNFTNAVAVDDTLTTDLAPGVRAQGLALDFTVNSYSVRF